MTINLQDIDQEQAWATGMVLPPGRHLCRIVEVEERESKGGHPQIVIKSQATIGEYAGFEITDYVVVIPSTYGKVKQILDAAGVEALSGSWEFDPKLLVGKDVAVFVKAEPKHDDPSKMRSEVAGYDMPRGSDVPPDYEGLHANGAPSSDDDIPF